MAINVAQISNPSIRIIPSRKLLKYISNIKISDQIPTRIKTIIFKNKVKDTILPEETKSNFLLDESDKKFISSLMLKETPALSVTDCIKNMPIKYETKTDVSNKDLLLSDLHWLYEYIQIENKNNDEKVYLHELIEESQIILPINAEIPRSKVLEERCKKLKAEQELREYHKMTKNVDNMRKRIPEDTIGHQIREMNKQLVAVLQFIISVVAGFAFGFIGIELLTGNLDFGFRLLLGIMCALTIALAELYFLAKKLNEEAEIEVAIGKQTKNIKVD